MAWSLETPHGVGATDGAEVADSVATMIFNATLPRLANLTLADEESRIGRGVGNSQTARWLEWALTDAESLPSYDATSGQSVLFDDLDTPETETADDRIVRAVFGAYAFLTEELGADRDQWRWGRMHTVTFGAVVPDLGGSGTLNIPPGDSEEFPNGFPRHGDYGAVDVGNFSMRSGTRFTHGSGASQRLVVEMTPEGPVAFNALPGGQSRDPDSPHFDDEAMLWIRNEQPAMFFHEADIVEHAEGRARVTPR
jgi:penicillin amidase